MSIGLVLFGIVCVNKNGGVFRECGKVIFIESLIVDMIRELANNSQVTDMNQYVGYAVMAATTGYFFIKPKTKNNAGK